MADEEELEETQEEETTETEEPTETPEEEEEGENPEAPPPSETALVAVEPPAGEMTTAVELKPEATPAAAAKEPEKPKDEELKIVIRIINDKSSFIGMQKTDCDPISFTQLEGGLEGVLKDLKMDVELALTRWKTNPRNPKVEVPKAPVSAAPTTSSYTHTSTTSRSSSHSSGSSNRSTATKEDVKKISRSMF